MKKLGVSYPITYGNLGYFQQTSDYDSTVKSNIILFFSTRLGERRLNKSYGTSIWNYIFENGLEENEEILKDIITKEIYSIQPNLNIKSIEIVKKVGGVNTYNIEVKIMYFSPNSTKNLQSITIDMPISQP